MRHIHVHLHRDDASHAHPLLHGPLRDEHMGFEKLERSLAARQDDAALLASTPRELAKIGGPAAYRARATNANAELRDGPVRRAHGMEDISDCFRDGHRHIAVGLNMPRDRRGVCDVHGSDYHVNCPKCLAAAIGRKKYGKAAFQRMAAAGRKK